MLKIRGGVICLFLLFILHPHVVVGANSQAESIVQTARIKLNAHHYTMEDGLPSNTIRCIHQDKQGFIWIGTSNGLCRYDGYQFNVFLPLPPDGNEPGLASNSVIEIFEDNNGYLWIQSSPRRLSCFDLKQGKFVDFTGIGAYNDFFEAPVLLSNGNVWVWNNEYIYKISHKPTGEFQTVPYKRSKEVLPEGIIRFVYEEKDGWTWIGSTSGLACISPAGEVHWADSTRNWVQSHVWQDEIHFVTVDGSIWCNADNSGDIKQTATLQEMSTKDKVVNENKTHNEWFIITNRRVYIYDMKSRIVTRKKEFKFPTPRLVHITDRKDILIYNQPESAYYMDSTYTNVQPLPLRKIEKGSLGYENYRTETDRDGNIWITTGENGLFIFNPRTLQLQQFTHSENPDLLQTNVLHNICIDREGTIWIGTSNAGLTKLSQAKQPTHKRILAIDTEEKGFENYIRLLNWRNDTLWVGTRRNLLQCYDKDFNLLSSKIVATNIYSMETDTAGMLWHGTRGRGLIINGKEVRHRRNVEKALQNGDIFKILKDSKGRIWLATFGGGLCLVTQDSTTTDGYAFRHFLKDSYGMLRVRDLAEDRKGYIWAATNDGLCIFHPDSLIASPTAYYHYSYTNNLFPATEIHTLLTDQSGESVWSGTIGQGLVRCTFNEKKGLNYTIFSTDDGLASNTITSLLHDDWGFIWIGTSQGLSRLDPGINSLHSFTFSKDPQGNCFSEGTSCKLPDGRLVFGTIHGMVVLDPRSINVTKSSANIAITELWINGRSIPYVVDEGINSSISHARHITLEHTQNSFELHFSDMIFNEGNYKKRFRYYMEGYDKGWKQSSTRNYASYQYLQPDTYIFHVETTDNNGLWSEKEAKLKITILPPWWKTWWFNTLCLILLGAVMLIIFKQVNRIAGLRRRIKVEKELSNFKTSLFANLLHEFRTPLTLIQVALEKVKETAPQTKSMKQAIDTMQQGADRMARLTYEIMQFHKIEAGQLSLALQSTDIVAFIHEIVKNFKELAVQKGVTLNFKSWQETYTLPIDRNHIDKITYNLLSNAFKYTPSESGCEISVELCMKDEKTLMMTISDTGIGVPIEKRKELFSRYMQTRMSGNSIGIGLNLSAELARIHHGALEYKPHIVEDADGNTKEKGSIFTLFLPALDRVYSKEEFLKADEGIPLEEHLSKNNMPTKTETVEEAEKAEVEVPVNPQRLLVVEDDADIRNMLVEELRELFEVFTATDGQEGTEKAKGLMPDLIISDVMMPRMDGFELTRKLKKDFNTSHIPIVLLTALNTPEKQTKGFEEGADAYISKPFNRDVLRARIVQLITQRQRLRDKFSREPETASPEICTTSLDRNFLTQLDELIELNIANSELRIDDLARKLGMSRTVFYNKIKGITGNVPIEYLRLARLKRASKMLIEHPDASMADVSYATGFNDPLYFSRVFKKHFGISPSDYRRKNDEGKENS